MEKEENQKMNIYLEKEINFFGEIKSIFHIFYGLYFGEL